MSDASQKAVIDAVVMLTAASRNMHLYPPTSQLIADSVGKAHAQLTLVLEESASFSLSEADGKLLINGRPLDDKFGVNPQLQTFLELLQQCGLSSLTFTPGIDTTELNCLLEHLGRTESSADPVPSLQSALDSQGVRHISLTPASVPAGVSSEMTSTGGSAVDHRQSSPLPPPPPPDPAPAVKERPAAGPPATDSDAAAAADQRPAEGLDAPNPSKGESRQQETQEEQETRQRRQREHVKTGITRLIKGDPGPLRDRQVMTAVPKTMERLIAKGHPRTAESLFQRLLPGMQTQASAHHETIALAIARSIPVLVDHLKADDQERAGAVLLKWLQSGAGSADGMSVVADQLQALVKGHFAARQWSQALPILEALRKLTQPDHSGHPLSPQAASCIDACPGPVTVPHLITALSGDVPQTGEAAERCIVALEATAVPHILERLKVAADARERLRLLDILIRIGKPGLPMVQETFQSRQKWYFTRNMLIVLRRVGSAADVPLIAPHLLHAETQVQREALTALYAVGGARRLKVLTAVVDRLEGELHELAAKMVAKLTASATPKA